MQLLYKTFRVLARQEQGLIPQLCFDLNEAYDHALQRQNSQNGRDARRIFKV